MQNLLRTLTESRVKSSLPQADLKLLLTTVKECRHQTYDAKLSDPFYDSLEGLLLDLRTVTMDNRDAEAFLKPVSKADVPDYHDVISSPMDMQTMLRKVKQKQYKSKREFTDDLDLIWTNCYTYNAAENHPLRCCARRLQIKAAKLLENITDRKERTDPPIPPDLAVAVTPTFTARTKSNGLVNGHSHRRSSSSTIGTPITKPKKPRRDVPFADTPAIIRTAGGMATFSQLDQELDRLMNTHWHSKNSPSLAERLRDFSQVVEYESGSEDVHSPDDTSISSDGTIGEKRKLNGIANYRPRKRSRLRQHTVNEDVDTVDLWWNAVQSDALIANGFPSIAYTSSDSAILGPSRSPYSTSQAKTKMKQRKRKRKTAVALPRSLLSLMNTNIRMMKRVRRTHAKFAALNVNSSNDDGEGSVIMDGAGSEEVDDVVDERPWIPRRSGIDIGQESATDCLHWMGGKVLEHAGFQGTSRVALDVLASLTSEYLLNVGRTILYLRDKYARKMTPEEIILHTLFESGTTKIQDLERYIKDDVVRYGARLGELEKKLVGAYREATAVEAVDDDAIFGNEDEEDEEGAFVMGNFTDAFGEDFLGLRELGIAAEHGLSSLSIPKRLLKGKGKGEDKHSSSAANPAEPPPPFPPPPPFVPLISDKVDDQIGLLKPYYQSRINALMNPAQHIPAMTLPHYAIAGYGYSANHPFPYPPANPLPITLPDDPPNPSQIKMGPLGQIIKGGPSGAAKKKAKRKDPPGPGFGHGPAVAAVELKPSLSASLPPTESPKKKGVGAGGGMGGKKAPLGGDALPSVVVASA